MFTIIPLAAIRDLSIGHYPRIMHPVGLDFISVTYDDNGETKRLFISPYESWFGLPSTFNRIVAEWFAAIRAAVVEATGCEPGNTPAHQLGVPPGSKALFAVLLLPLILGSTLVLAVLRSDTGDAAIRPFLGGALAIILGVLGFGFLALVLGRVFGDGSNRGSGGSPRQASWLPPIVLVGRRGGQAVIHWPGVLLIFLTVLALGESGAMVGSWVLIGRISVVSVGLVLIGAVVLMASLIHRGRATPLEQLTTLDRPDDKEQEPALEAATGTAVPFPPPSPPRASAWPGVVFMIGMALLMTLVVVTVFVGVLGWWMK